MIRGYTELGPKAPREVPMEPVIAILGATATGKSALALALAEILDGEIINADALQVYRGFDIGTAKPTAEERARVPHHLLDILEPWQRYSAGDFARRAREAIADIRSRGKRPLVVGGSGLYLRALFEGISPIPPGDPALRRQLRQRLEDEGLPALVAELESRDPATVARLAAGDSQRILRALEVVMVSGVPLSRWIERQPFGDQRLSAMKIGLTLPRAILYDLIAVRVTRMVNHGWLEEVQRLLSSGLTQSLPAFQAIGYRQLAGHLQGESSLSEAAEEITRQTRRFAKRQETWFRKEPEVVWVTAGPPDELTPRILELIERSGSGRAHA